MRARGDPAASCVDQLVVRERRKGTRRAVRASPRIPRPENESLFLVVLQEAGSVEPVIFLAVDERATHFRAAQYSIVQILPPHRERRQVPAVTAGHARRCTLDVGLLCHGR